MQMTLRVKQAVTAAAAFALRSGVIDLSLDQLDYLVHGRVVDISRLRREFGISILLIEQDAASALEIADYSYIMEGGRIVYEGSPDKLRNHKDVQEFYLGAGDAEAAWRTLSPDLDATEDAADLVLAAMGAMLTDRVSEAAALVRRAIDLKPGEATAQAILSLALLRQRDAEDARDAAELALAFAPDDVEIAAVASLAGADPNGEHAPLALPANTPAQAARAACVAALSSGDVAAARVAGAAWSLCHLAAVTAR